MVKTETILQNQNAAIKNLKTYVGPMAAELASRAHGTLPCDTEKNLREQVLTVEAVNYAIIEKPSIKHTNPVPIYVTLIPFPQRLQRQLKKEQVSAITMRSGVLMPKTTS